MDHRINAGRGFKFLDQNGMTTAYVATQYALPQDGQRWGEWMDHPDPVEFDGESCGPGRYHIMKRLNTVYSPVPYCKVWWAQYENVVGTSDEKMAVTRLRLRAISPRVLGRIIRSGWADDDGELSYLDMQGLDLRGANLSEFTMHRVNLQGANLEGANLDYVDLSNSNLIGANLAYTSLEGANLEEANLSHANLEGAWLQDARLANTWFKYANLTDANLDCAEVYNTVFSAANLTGVNTDNIDIRECNFTDTIFEDRESD